MIEDNIERLRQDVSEALEADNTDAIVEILGDINVAEPGALIGFTGQRVIEQTIHEKLPEGFQRSEFLLEHGFLDLVVPRTELKSTLGTCLRHLT